MSNGLVIYRGPSVLDGSPIVVIATGLGAGSSNRKPARLSRLGYSGRTCHLSRLSRAGLMFQSVALAHIVGGSWTGKTRGDPAMLTSDKLRSMFGEPIIEPRSPMASSVRGILRRARMNCRLSSRGAWSGWALMATLQRFPFGYGRQLWRKRMAEPVIRTNGRTRLWNWRNGAWRHVTAKRIECSLGSWDIGHSASLRRIVGWTVASGR